MGFTQEIKARHPKTGMSYAMNHRYFKMDAVPVSDTARYADTPRYGPIRVSGSIEKL